MKGVLYKITYCEEGKLINTPEGVANDTCSNSSDFTSKLTLGENNDLCSRPPDSVQKLTLELNDDLCLTLPDITQKLALGVIDDLCSTSTKSVQEHKLGSVYYGETSRPARMRAQEHFRNLENLKHDSVLLNHWIRAHYLQMEPPRYKFQNVKSFGDSLSRQISEAIHIEERGSMNRKSEYGHNHLTRLEANRSEWEQEVRQVSETAFRNCDRVNTNGFIAVVRNVKNEIMSTQETVSCYRLFKKRVWREQEDLDIELQVQKKKKRKKDMDSSTPIWGYRTRLDEVDDSLSPARLSPILNFSGGSFSSTCGQVLMDDSGEDVISVKTVALTPQLRGLLIKPVCEDEYTELKRVIQETINLTRAAIWRGIMNTNDNQVLLLDPLEENTFFRPFGYFGTNSVAELMDNLDLSDWDLEEMLIEVEVNRQDSRRFGVLVGGLYTEHVEHLPRNDQNIVVDGRVINGLSVEGNTHQGWNPYEQVNYQDMNLGRRLFQDLDEREHYQNQNPGRRLFQEHEVTVTPQAEINSPEFKTLNEMNDYVQGILSKSDWAVSGERKHLGGVASASLKRKETSPSFQSDSVLRIRRNDGGSSPSLRPRQISMNSAGGPNRISPPNGGTCKKRRRVVKPKKVFNDNKKQLLITSSFSPRVSSKIKDEGVLKKEQEKKL